MIDKILLEIGHGDGNAKGGGYDPGATSGIWTEHEIVSTLARGVAQAFSGSDTEVTLVPDTLSLKNTVEWINGAASKTTALLSLHMNAASSNKARGVEVVVASTAPEERRRKALEVATVLAKTLRIPLRKTPVLVDSDTPRGRLAILRDTACEAYLAELGFITSMDDRVAVQSRGVSAVAEAIRTLTGSNV